MAFVYPAVAIAADVLGPNRLRCAPNVQRESFYLTKMSFFQRIWVLDRFIS